MKSSPNPDNSFSCSQAHPPPPHLFWSFLVCTTTGCCKKDQRPHFVQQQTCHQLQPSIPPMQPNDLAFNHAMNSNSSVFGIEAKALPTAISSWHGDLARDCSGFQLRKPALWKEQEKKKKNFEVVSTSSDFQLWSFLHCGRKSRRRLT